MVVSDGQGWLIDKSALVRLGASPDAELWAGRIEPAVALRSRLETAPEAAARAWNYVTLGHGHDEAFWLEFCAALQRVGYDDVLSIEHEDQAMDPVEAVTESVQLLRQVTAGQPV